MATPPLAALLDTYQSIVTTFSDFLVVAIHTVLYERALYPASTFISTRKYNFPVRQNRHPRVCKWITDAVAAVEEQIILGCVQRVVLVIYSQNAEVLERFLFDISGFPSVPIDEIATTLDREDPSGSLADRSVGISLTDVEEQLRAAMMKLACCGGKLGALLPGCTYSIAIELKDKAEPPLGHPQPWVPSQPSLQTGRKEKNGSTGKDIGGSKTLPVYLVEAGEFILETWVEEGRAKLELQNKDQAQSSDRLADS